MYLLHLYGVLCEFVLMECCVSLFFAVHFCSVHKLCDCFMSKQIFFLITRLKMVFQKNVL